MNKDRNMLIDRLGYRSNSYDREDNSRRSEQDELSGGDISTLAGIENVNGRITKLEHSIVELTNTINGVMNELMDQKSILNAIYNKNDTGRTNAYEKGHLLRPRHQHSFNVRSADERGTDPEGSSRIHVQHDPATGAIHANVGGNPDYIIADVDRSGLNRTAEKFKGEYIIADDRPVRKTKKQNPNVRYNEEDDVVVYEKGSS